MDIEFLKKSLYDFTSLGQVKEIIENSKDGNIDIVTEIENEKNIVLSVNVYKRMGYSGYRKKYTSL